MQYVLTTGWEDGIADLAQRLARELADGKQVLWLVSGGSNIPASVQVMNSISSNLSRNLSVTLADERYGEEGHEHSNWTALMKAGFEGEQAHLLPILEAKLNFEATVLRYRQLAAEAMDTADCIVGQFGIGEDGHIAGILPDSMATHETPSELVIGYHSSPYDRLTLTFPAIRRVTVAYAFAFGEAKEPALETLQTKMMALDKQPAQILKQLPEAYVYNDQRGDT